MRIRCRPLLRQGCELTVIFIAAIAVGQQSPAIAAIHPGDSPITFSIPSGPLERTLQEFASQAHLQVVYETSYLLTARPSADLIGAYTPRAALMRLLKDNNGLQYAFVNERTVSITRAQEPHLAVANNSPNENPTSYSDTESGVVHETPPPEGEGAVDHAVQTPDTLEEIVVTGSYIRDGVNTGSPVLTIEKEEIARSGYASVRDVILALPQNSGSGMGENTVALPYGNGNNGYAAGVNLRGLGSNSTLVLLDGHRLAPTGVGGAVDLSMIPLSAVERVEVLTDGASAIYGSDAVGGVVNIITNKQFNGFVSDIQYGGDTAGDIKEYRASQTAGRNWGSGQFAVTYEYYDRGALRGSDRSFASGLPEPTDLTPEQRRNSIVAFGSQNIIDALSAYVDILYSDQHKSVIDSTQPQNPVFTTDDSSQLAVTPGIKLALAGDWVADISANYGRNSLLDQGSQLAQDILNIGNTRNVVYGGELRADGTAIKIPSGDIKAAVGIAFRREEFDASGSSGGTPVPTISASRNVDSVYGELSIPLVSSGMTVLTHELALSAAARLDRYSDTGSSVTPKIGLGWAPITDLMLRGTWSRSYHAPDLNDKHATVYALAVDLPDPNTASGTDEVLGATGGNPNLGPERSTTYTLGFDITPVAWPGFRTSLTYFNTDYRNRVGSPVVNVLTVLSEPALAGNAVIASPSPQFLNQFLSTALVTNYLGRPFSVSDVNFFVDDRNLNLAQTRERGLDAQIKDNWELDGIALGAHLNGAFLFENKQRVLASAPWVSLLNTIFYTPRVRIFGGVNAARGWLAGSVLVHYTGGYWNNQLSPPQSVSSYTTADFQLSADFGLLSSSAMARGLSISFTLRNFLDRAPPAIHGSAGFFENAPYGYDPANADPIGRFATVRLQKKW